MTTFGNAVPRHYADDDSKIAWTARIATSTPPLLALVCTFVLGMMANRGMNVPSGAFQGASLALFFVGTAVAVVGWQKPLLGGALALLLGVPVMSALLSAIGEPPLYYALYGTFCAAFVLGGALHLFKGILRRRNT